MRYIIMIAIVLGLAVSDFITGVIKGYVKSELSSSKMRRGGVNKLCELVVMATACGLEIGITALGHYYDSSALASVTGTVTATAVFIYITIMELVSILENYSAINTEASWAEKLINRLKGSDRK